MAVTTWEYVGDGWFIRHDPDGGYMDLYLGTPTTTRPMWYCGISRAGWMYGDADSTWPVEKAGDLATALTCLAHAWADGPAEHRREEHDRLANLDGVA